jgi:hypothetical protein
MPIEALDAELLAARARTRFRVFRRPSGVQERELNKKFPGALLYFFEIACEPIEVFVARLTTQPMHDLHTSRPPSGFNSCSRHAIRQQVYIAGWRSLNLRASPLPMTPYAV